MTLALIEKDRLLEAGKDKNKRKNWWQTGGMKHGTWENQHSILPLPKILTWCSNPSANLLIVEEGNLGRQFPPAPSEVAIWKSSKERRLQPKPLLGMTHVNSEMPSLSSLS